MTRAENWNNETKDFGFISKDTFSISVSFHLLGFEPCWNDKERVLK